MDEQASKKKKLIRGNSEPHINRNLRWVIIKKSGIKNIANKTKNPNDNKNYERQRNYTVNLKKGAKFEYFNRYNSKDSRPFWVSCKPHFSNKNRKADTGNILAENEELVLKSNKIANTFNEYFVTIVQDIDLYYWKDHSELLTNTKSLDKY